MDGFLDLVVGGSLLEPDSQIDNGNIRGWDAESHTGQLSVVQITCESMKTQILFLLNSAYPLSSGMTFPTALAAPVDDGMMFWWAPRPPTISKHK